MRLDGVGLWSKCLSIEMHKATVITKAKFTLQMLRNANKAPRGSQPRWKHPQSCRDIAALTAIIIMVYSAVNTEPDHTHARRDINWGAGGAVSNQDSINEQLRNLTLDILH